MARVLLVDDEQSMRRTLREILERDGYAAEEAANGRIAIDMLGRSTFDLVVTDMFMPEADGVDVLRAIAELAPDTPVIGISGGGAHMPGALALSMMQAMGAYRVLFKPFRAGELRAAVTALLSER